MGGELEKAQEILASIPKAKAKDSDVISVQAQIDLILDVAEAGDPATLSEALTEAPQDLSARFELAKAHIATGDFEGAVEHLLFIIKQDRTWQEDAARKQLLKVFDAAGPMAEVTRQGRRKLSLFCFPNPTAANNEAQSW